MILEDYDNFGNKITDFKPDSGVDSFSSANLEPPQGMIGDNVNNPTAPAGVMAGGIKLQFQGKTSFDDTNPGYILGVDAEDGKAKFNVGNSSAYFKFDGSTTTIAPSLTTTSLDIPDTTTVNSMHVESDGDTYWGANVATGFSGAPASVSKAGVGTFSDITITGGKFVQGAASVIVQKRTTGEAYSANDALYLKKSDGRVYKATAAASDEKIFNFIGFAKEAATGAAETKEVYESGYIPGFSGLTAGSWYYVTDTAGSISTTPGTYFKRIGLAMSATEIYLIRDNLRTAQSSGTFAITNLGANPGSTTITTGFRPSLIVARLGHKNNAATAPVWFDTTTTTVFSRITYFASFFSGLHRGFSYDMGGGGTQLAEIATALFTDVSAGQGSPSLKIATLTDTGFNVTLTNDGTNTDVGSRWEVIAIA